MQPPRAEIARERRRQIQVRKSFSAGLDPAAPWGAGDPEAFYLACSDYLLSSMDRLHDQDQMIHDLLRERIDPAEREAHARQHPARAGAVRPRPRHGAAGRGPRVFHRRAPAPGRCAARQCKHREGNVMTHRKSCIRQGLAALAATTALGLAGPALAADEVDHSTMDHSAMERDELGRTGYNMKHAMDPALVKELREKVALYKDYSDAEIALSMDMMGMEYAWYISPPQVKGAQGVLILMHGFREAGDKIFRDKVQPIGDIFPTSMGVGMAMMMSSHIQTAVDDLEAAGAKEIVVVPVTSSATNELYRQWLYVFGRQEKAEFATVPRVTSDAAIRIVPPPGDDPLIAEALLDYATEISTDPAKEVVVIAGHGPSSAEDNAEEMKVLAALAKIIREDGGFAAVYGQTLQDDAPAEIREANVQKLRGLVEQATKDGKTVLVVTNLISARSIQAKLRDDLKGLEFKFNAKGIAQHPNFMKWMTEGVRAAFEKKTALCC